MKGALAVVVLTALLSGGTHAAPPRLEDKTLVVWVSPANLEQQGGAVVSLMSGERFDALVLGEKARGRWMAGSDFFKRTHADQTAWPAETAPPGHFVQVALVYAGSQVMIYRDGQRYAGYDADHRESFGPDTAILIGARYRGGMGEIGFFAGDIDEVRVYGQALDEPTIRALRPGRIGQPKPVGMWTFNEGAVVDRMGQFPKGHLMNGARLVDGCLRLDGRSQYALIAKEPPPTRQPQAGFFTPRRRGMIWDTWMYFHAGRYYMFYLAGAAGHWDGHELATSKDGVHWKEHGVVVKPRSGVTWMGTGHIWKAPDFASSHRWVMNYSEWFGDRQDIMFVTSTDLLHWTHADERYRFRQDTRWYQEKGRWDCLDTVEREDGSLYGYFTADPLPGKVGYQPCGFGFAESQDGLAWTARPPVEGDLTGEFGGIERIGDRYFILISEGRVGVGAQPTGPFRAQSKNPNAFGAGCDIYFPRFFHNAPGGPLVNHFYTGGPVFAALVKAIEVDPEGTLRLKWWRNNDRLKARSMRARLVAPELGSASPLRLLDQPLDLRRTHVIEGTVTGVTWAAEPSDERPGLYFDLGHGAGRALLLSRDAAQFGEIRADGSAFKPLQTSARDLDLGPVLKFRLVLKEDMMELYLNDYLMNLKRVPGNGRVGFLDPKRAGRFQNIRVWRSR